MLDKVALAVGGVGVGFAAMYFLMHREGAPFQETGMVVHEDTTSPWTYVGIGVGSVAAGMAASHFYHKSA